MSGIDDLLAESNERWATAGKRAQGIADNGMGDALKIYYTRFLPAGLVGLISLGTLGGMLVMGATPGEWPSYLLVGCLLAVLGVAIGGLAYNAKCLRPAVNHGRTNVLLTLESHEQKHVRRQIMGKSPLDPEHLTVARGVAVQMRKGLATQLLLAPVYPLAFIPQAVSWLLRGDPVLAWIMGILVVGLFIATGLLAREFRRTGTFLEGTAEQNAGES